MTWKSYIVGDNYGKWIKEGQKRNVEAYMEKADKDTLKDGVRYYRGLVEVIGLMYLVVILVGGVVFVNLAMDDIHRQSAIVDSMNKAANNREAIMGEHVSTVSARMCELYSDKLVGWDNTNEGGVVVYCEARTIGIQKQK
jgi:hypothetical protein